MGEELRAGDVIAGRYELRVPLGRGGTSTTWRALDRSTNLEVALKRLEVARAADWKFVELFEREGQLLSQLEHPAIPRYLGAFTVEGPGGTSFFLAQSLIEGASLAEHVEQRGTFSEAETRDIARQVLAILADLHALQPPILHRDLKPANIVLDASKRVHLVDFGAARRRGEDTGSTVVGTYGFMAPEQLRGSATAASDLYGLGGTLVYLLYRQSPAELPQTRLRVELPGKPALTPAFAAFLRRLLEPAPEDRFQSAAAALVGMDARPPSSSRVALLGAALVVALAGGGFVAWRGVAKPPPLAVNGVKPSVAELPPRLELYRYPELRDLERVAAHTSAVLDVAPSPDGKYVATASFDRTAKVWSAETWKAVASVGHDGPVGGARFANETTLVTGGDHTVRTWQLPEGKPGLVINAGATQISAIDVHSGVVAASSFDGSVRLISLTDGAVARTVAHSGGRVLHVAFSPDGARLASAGDDRAARIWNVADGKPLQTLTGATAAISHVAFSPDGTMLAATGDDKLVRVFLVSDGKLVTTLKDASDHTWGVAWSPAGDHLLVGGKDARLRAYGVPTFALRYHEDDASKGTLSISFGADKKIFTGHGDGTFHVRALPGAPLRPLPVPKPAVPTIRPNGPKELVLARESEALIDRWQGHRAELDGAEKLAEEALTLRPKYALALAQLARIEMRRGLRSGKEYDPARLLAAKKLADAAVASDPKCYEAREILAWVLVRQRDLEGARRATAAAEAVAPQNPASALLRAEIAVREKAWAEAERVLRAAIEGGFADARVLDAANAALIEIYTGLEEFDAVDQLHRRDIALHPKSAWSRGNYAAFLNNRGQYGRAIELATEALAISDFPLAHHLLAHAHTGAALEALWDRRDRKLATTHIDLALKARPTADARYVFAAIHRMRAVEGRDRGALAESRAQLEAALKLEPGHEYAKLALEELGEVERNL